MSLQKEIEYNSVYYKLVENIEYEFYINLNKPKTKKEIDKIISKIGKGKYYATDLDHLLGGSFISDENRDKDGKPKLKEPCYCSIDNFDLSDEEKGGE